MLLLAYLLLVLPVIAVTTPPWQNPDEPFHLLRAVQIAHGELLGRRAWGSAGGDSDPAIYDAFMQVHPVAMHPERRITRPALAASGAAAWHTGTQYAHFPNTVQYGPAFYVPDAAAYWLGRAAGLSVNHTLLLARLANAALYAGIAAAAVGIARRARLPLAALLLLPTSLSLAASANQDSELYACTALAVALLDRATCEPRATTPGESRLLAVLFAGIFMARPPYGAFLLAMRLTVPAGRPVAWRLPLAACAAGLAWCALVAWHVSVHLGGSDAGRQLALLQADPGRIPGILATTFRTFTLEYAVQFIGVLGWTDTRLPPAYIILAGGTLLLAFLAGTAGPARRPLWPLAGAILATAAIFVLQYITWTWPGQPLITGVLGRYFPPIAMVLTLALPRLNLPLAPAAWFAVGLQAMVAPAIMLHAIVLRYYLYP